MGLTYSHDVPLDTPFALCARMLKGLGVRHVILPFEGVVMPCEKTRPCLPEYTLAAKYRWVNFHKPYISADFIAFLQGAITQGIAVHVVTTATTDNNGNIRCNADGFTGYQWQGQELVKLMLTSILGEHVSTFVHVVERTSFSTALMSIAREYHISRPELLVLTTEPNLVVKVRKHHSLAWLVTDKEYGFVVS